MGGDRKDPFSSDTTISGDRDPLFSSDTSVMEMDLNMEYEKNTFGGASALMSDMARTRAPRVDPEEPERPQRADYKKMVEMGIIPTMTPGDQQKLVDANNEGITSPALQKVRNTVSDILGLESYIKEPDLPPGLGEAAVDIELIKSKYGDDEAAMIESSYYLADLFFMEPDEAFEKIALYEDLAELSGRNFFQFVKDGWDTGWYNSQISEIGEKMAAEGLVGNYSNINDYIEQIKEISALIPPEVEEGTGFFNKIFGKAAAMIPMQLRAEVEALPYAFAGAGTAAVTTAIIGNASPLIVIPEELVTIPASAIAGWMVGRRTGKVVSLANQIRGAYMVKQIQAGVDPQIAAWVSIPIAIGSALLEQAQFEKTLALIPGKARGLGKIFQEATERAMGGGLFGKVVKGIARGAGTYTQENVEEQAQFLTEAFGEDLMAAAEEYLLGKDVEYHTAKSIAEGMRDTWNESKHAILGMMAGPAMMGIMSDVMFSPETIAEMEDGPAGPSTEEVLIKDKAADFDTADEYVEWAQATIGEEAIAEEDLRGIHEQVMDEAPIEEKALRYDTAEEFVESEGDKIPTEGKKSKEEFVNWEFDMPESMGNAPYTPKKAFALRGAVNEGTDEIETVATVVADGNLIQDYEIPPALVEAAENDSLITVYRVDDNAGIIPGAYVSESLEYVEQHGEGVLKGDYFLQSEQVYADELMTRGDPHEFLYIPRDEDIAYERYAGKEVAAELTKTWNDAHGIVDETEVPAGEIQADIDMGLYNTVEEAISHAHEMYDEENLPDDSAITQMFEESQPVEQEPVSEEFPEDIPAEDMQVEKASPPLSGTDPTFSGEEREDKGMTARAEGTALTDEQAFEEEAADRVLEPQMIEPDKKTVKQQVRKTTGETKMYRMIAEDKALKQAIGMMQRTGKAAFTEGKKAGVADTRAKVTARDERRAAKLKELNERRAEIKAQKDRIKGYKEDIQKVIKEKLPKMDPKQKAEIEALVEGLNFTKQNTGKVVKLEKTAEFLRNNPDHDMPQDVVDQLHTLNNSNWNWMSPDEAETLHDAVLMSASIADKKKKLRVGSQDRDLDKTVNAVAKTTIRKKPATKNTGPTDAKAWKKGARYARDLVGISQSRPDVVIDQMFGKNSPGREVFGRAIEEAVAADLAYRQGKYDNFRDSLEAKGFTQGNKAGDWIAETETIETPDGTWKLERGQRISIYLHTFDQDNYESMQKGVGFDTAENKNKVYDITAEDIQAIVDSLSPDELAWAEAAKEVFKDTGQDLQDEFFNINWYRPPMRENYMRKDGMSVARNGAVDAAGELAIDQSKHKHRVGVDKKMLIDRKDTRNPIYIHNIAEELNIAILRTSAYVNLEQPLQTAHKVLTDPRVKKALLGDNNDESGYRYLTKYLEDVAGEQSVYQELTGGFNKLRGGITKYALGANMWVAGKQALSYPFAAMYVKPKYLMLGALDETFHPIKTKAQHEGMSSRYRERREGGYSRSIAEALEKNTASKRLLDKKTSPGELMMKPTQYVDAKTVSSMMSGAIRQAMDEFKTGQISPEVQDALGSDTNLIDIQNMTGDEQLELAYKFADYVSMRTQPQFSPDMLSQMQRGGDLARMFTQFSGFTNQEQNMLKRALVDINQGKGIEKYKKLAYFSMSFLANAVGIWQMDAMRDRLRGKEEEDIKDLPEVIADSFFGMFYGIRDVQKAVKNEWQDNIDLPVSRLVTKFVGAVTAVDAFVKADTPSKREAAAIEFAQTSLEMLMMRYGIPYVAKRAIESIFRAGK